MPIPKGAHFTCLLAILLLTGVSLPSRAADLTIGAQLQLGDDLSSSREKLQKFCKDLKVFEAASPRYPLAEKREQHLVCDQYDDTTITFGKAVLVIADDQFVHLEAMDVNLPVLQEVLGETDNRYLDMAIYQHGSYWLDENRRRFIWLHADARHPNLFAWHNPRLDTVYDQAESASIEIPELFDFTSNLEKLRPLFTGRCKQTREEKHDKVWLPNKPDVQIQINCFGYEYGGFERKFEAVFGDGKLQLIWILTAKAEEARIRKLLQDRWGQPDTNTADWEVYAEGRISLRKDKPELLVLSDQMIPLYRAKFESTTGD